MSSTDQISRSFEEGGTLNITASPIQSTGDNSAFLSPGAEGQGELDITPQGVLNLSSSPQSVLNPTQSALNITDEPASPESSTRSVQSRTGRRIAVSVISLSDSNNTGNASAGKLDTSISDAAADNALVLTPRKAPKDSSDDDEPIVRENQEEPDAEDAGQCATCGGVGLLVLCETCGTGNHLPCVGLSQAPDGPYHCSGCFKGYQVKTSGPSHHTLEEKEQPNFQENTARTVPVPPIDPEVVKRAEFPLPMTVEVKQTSDELERIRNDAENVEDCEMETQESFQEGMGQPSKLDAKKQLDKWRFEGMIAAKQTINADFFDQAYASLGIDKEVLSSSSTKKDVVKYIKACLQTVGEKMDNSAFMKVIASFMGDESGAWLDCAEETPEQAANGMVPEVVYSQSEMSTYLDGQKGLVKLRREIDQLAESQQILTSTFGKWEPDGDAIQGMDADQQKTYEATCKSQLFLDFLAAQTWKNHLQQKYNALLRDLNTKRIPEGYIFRCCNRDMLTIGEFVQLERVQVDMHTVQGAGEFRSHSKTLEGGDTKYQLGFTETVTIEKTNPVYGKPPITEHVDMTVVRRRTQSLPLYTLRSQTDDSDPILMCLPDIEEGMVMNATPSLSSQGSVADQEAVIDDLEETNVLSFLEEAYFDAPDDQIKLPVQAAEESMVDVSNVLEGCVDEAEDAIRASATPLPTRRRVRPATSSDDEPPEEAPQKRRRVKTKTARRLDSSGESA